MIPRRFPVARSFPVPRIQSCSMLALAAVLAACQPDGNRPVVSLDQARQITTDFQGQSFVPPPRTISDIAAILDQQKPDPAKLAAATAAADAQPPAGLSPVELAEFHFKRSNAARELGRDQQRRDDARLAYEAGVAAGLQGRELGRFLRQWATAEQHAGNRRLSYELHARAIEVTDSPFQRVDSLQTMIQAATSFGEVERAREHLAAMRELQSRMQRNPRIPPAQLAIVETNVLRASSRIEHGSGNYAEAERLTRRAMAANERVEAGGDQQAERAYRALWLRSDLARSLGAQGRLLEAEVEQRAALLGRLSLQGRYSGETIATVTFLGIVVLQQGRGAEAERLGRAGVESLEAMRYDPGSALYGDALTLVARAEAAQGNWEAAARTYEGLRQRMAGQPELLRRTFDENRHWGMTALRTGRVDEARRILSNVVAIQRQRYGERHWETATSRGMLGAALARAGDIPGALREFDAAAPILLQVSRQSEDEEGGNAFRDTQLRTIFEAMMGALARSGRPGAAEESFRLADAIRGQGVQRALSQSSARASASDPALADLARREQDAQKQVGALQAMLTGMLAQADRDEAAARALRVQVDALRGARAALREEIERRFPDYASLVDPRPATVEQARRSLRQGEALLATYVGNSQSFAWAVPKDGPVAFAAVPVSRPEMAQAVAGLRKSLDPNAATLGDIPAFDVAGAHRLYELLLKPVEAGWASAQSLLVVPHDVLGQLPFGVLVTAPSGAPADRAGEALFSGYRGVPFLARKLAISQLPSVASLATLRALPAAPANRRAFIGFGDPWFSPAQMAEARAEGDGTLRTRGAAARTLQTRSMPLQRRNAPATASLDSAEIAALPRLPDTADEVRGIALALKADAADVILGAAANEKTVKTTNLANRKVVMFATHGLVPGDLNGLLQPALALTAPSVADVDGDGLLTLEEILGLKLDADWVVLSACNTATGDGAGAEAVSGLGRAFFYAGTRALLVTNWPVETTSARALTTDLFARQAREPGLGRAAALQQSMMALVDGPGYVDPASGRTAFSYAHPIFWAPFALVGDGGGPGPRQSAQRPANVD
jgi:CHAT domain-containing protein/tetratricopeptide (TPR) repeat protein